MRCPTSRRTGRRASPRRSSGSASFPEPRRERRTHRPARRHTRGIAHDAARRPARRLLQTLVSERGEATGATLARRAAALYGGLDEVGRLRLFDILATRFSPDRDAVLAAAHAYH